MLVRLPSVVVQTIESKEHRLILKHDGIVRVYSKPTNVELEDVQLLLSKFHEVRNGGDKLIVLMDPTEENSMSSDARNYIMHHLKDEVGVLAVIGRKKFNRTIFKIISSFVDIGVELKMFASEAEAEGWLRENYVLNTNN